MGLLPDFPTICHSRPLNSDDRLVQTTPQFTMTFSSSEDTRALSVACVIRAARSAINSPFRITTGSSENAFPRFGGVVPRFRQPDHRSIQLSADAGQEVHGRCSKPTSRAGLEHGIDFPAVC